MATWVLAAPTTLHRLISSCLLTITARLIVEAVTIHRFAATRVTAALKDTPVVKVAGPRQGGKTTFVRTPDDETALEGARLVRCAQW